MENAYQESSTNRAMDDVKQMSIRADPTTTENKQEKLKSFISFGLFFYLKENIKVLQAEATYLSL